MAKFTLETSGGPSRAFWFVLGAVSGFIFATGVAVRTLYVFLEMAQP